MTRDEWIERYEVWVVGLALKGLVLDTDEVKGPFSAGQAALKLPDKVRSLLGRMWADAQQHPLPTGGNNGNGKAEGTPRTRLGTTDDGKDRQATGRA